MRKVAVLFSFLVIALCGAVMAQVSDSSINVSKVRQLPPTVYAIDTTFEDTTLWPQKGLAKGDTAELVLKINGQRQWKYTAIDTVKIPKTWRLVPTVRLNWMKTPRDTTTGNLIR
jgi:hypothetical protein